jgi:hypothetical protein
MLRTMLAMSLALAPLTSLAGKAVAGPPEVVSGRMVLDGNKVRTPAGVLVIRQTPDGMVVEGPGFQGRAKCIKWQEDEDLLYLEGTETNPAILKQRLPGKIEKDFAAVNMLFSPRTGLFLTSRLRTIHTPQLR